MSTFALTAQTVKRNVLALRQIYRASSDRKLPGKWAFRVGAFIPAMRPGYDRTTLRVAMVKRTAAEP
jgi:hypothetical protein